MATIKQGTVKFPAGKTFSNKFNPTQLQQNIVLSMNDGSEERLYFAAGQQPYASLAKGQAIQLLFEPQSDGKIHRKLIDSSSPTPVNNLTPKVSHPLPQKPQSQTLSNETKKAIANYVNDRADLLAFCLDTANKKFAGKVNSEESFRTLAITLYIDAQKKFN